MAPRLPLDLIAELPDGSLFDKYTSDVPTDTLAYTDPGRRLAARIKAAPMLARVKAVDASMAISLITALTDQETLDKLVATERRKTVRLAALKNPRTSSSVVAAQVVCFLRDRAFDSVSEIVEYHPSAMLDALTADQTLVGVASPACAASGTIRNNLATRFQTIDGTALQAVLGVSADATELLSMVLEDRATFDIKWLKKVAASFVTSDEHRCQSRYRTAIASKLAVEGDAKTVLALCPYPQSVKVLLSNSNLLKDITYDDIAPLLTGASQDDLRHTATMLLRYNVESLTRGLLEMDYALGGDVTVRCLPYRANGVIGSNEVADFLIDKLAQSSAEGDKALRRMLPITSALKLEQMTRVLCAMGEEDFKSLGGNNTRERIQTLSADELSGLLDALAGSQPVVGRRVLAYWLDTKKEVTETVADAAVKLILAEAAMSDRPGYSRTGVPSMWADFPLTDGHLAMLVEQYETAGVSAPFSLLGIALHNRYWLTDARESLRDRALAAAQLPREHHGETRSFWEIRTTRDIPAILATADGVHLAANFPAAADHVRERMAVLGVDSWRPVMAGLLGSSRLNWGSLADPNACKATAAFLAEHLASPQEWETALGLLPEWTGTLDDLVSVTKSL